MIGRRGLMAAAGAMALAGASAPRPRVLAFGDSLFAGYGLGRGQGMVPQLQAWLDHDGTPATVIPAALSGDTTYGGRARIGFSLRRHRPDAVIVELGGNDMLLRWSASRAEANLDAILTQAGAGGRPLLLVGLNPIPGKAAWRQSWKAIWPRLAGRHRAVLLPDLYAPIAALPRSRRRGYLLDDGIHPNAAGIRLMAAALGPKVRQMLG
ncbi:arylesterase [Paracoccus benzoatiresistens]|uniref:Arylesterase n=1 Tax=Paracoccus benzoatiresistens TaxID=2997341 RepID=A0ABT4J1Q1_9RHOB|nr:arylesterase [Paracoccus sp. EF6]MCZ0960356.1 arylesterase [Paracoccus sp. EF6]